MGCRPFDRPAARRLGAASRGVGARVAWALLGATAPANLYHFVGYPAVAFTLEPTAAPTAR